MRPQSIRLVTAVLAIAVLLERPAWCPARDTKGDAPQKRTLAHPLDPLSKEELEATVAVLRDAGKVAESTRFVLIHLHEPPKAKVLAYRPGDTLPRQAFAILYDWASNTTSEAIVDLTG